MRRTRKPQNDEPRIRQDPRRAERGGGRGERTRGRVYPILPDSLAAAFWRAKEAAGLRGADLRLHDLRHTAATATLRATGNLVIVQKQLRHKRITTTARYAHVLDDDLRDGLNAANPVGPVARKMRDRG